MLSNFLINANSNSIFIVLNLHLKTDSRHTKQKKQETIIINLTHSRGQRHGERPGKAEIMVDMLCKETGFELLLKEWREEAECISSGKSLQIFEAS